MLISKEWRERERVNENEIYSKTSTMAWNANTKPLTKIKERSLNQCKQSTSVTAGEV